MDNYETADIAEVKEPSARRIGGWLLLVAIGLVIGPMRILDYLFTDYLPLFSNGTWDTLTSVDSEYYIPGIAVLMISELLINVLVIIVSIYLIVLFFKKKSVFPKWYAGLAVFSLVFILLDAYSFSLLVPEIEMFDADTVKEISRSLISCLIWAPYLLISSRAKETFVY